MTLFKSSLIACYTMLIISCQAVYADSLSELKATLTALNGADTITAVLSASFKKVIVDGNDKKIKFGALQTELIASPSGLTVSYNSETLRKLREEGKQKRENEEAATPTLMAAREVKTDSLTSILSSADILLAKIEQGELINEERIDYNGGSVRSLTFSLPLQFFIENKKVRGYVDEFESSYQVLINDQGIPFETRMNFSGEGTAYVIFSLETVTHKVTRYKVFGDRLVRISKESKSINNSTFNDRTFESSWQVEVTSQVKNKINI